MADARRDFPYSVCLSYAGEDRAYVLEVVEALKALDVGNVFYDRSQLGTLLTRDLKQRLNDIYERDSKHCVVFLSSAYLDKKYPRHELKSAEARALEDETYLMLASFDHSTAPGEPSTTHQLDLSDPDMTPQAVAQLIAEWIRNPRPVTPRRTTGSMTWHRWRSMAIAAAMLIVLVVGARPAYQSLRRLLRPSHTSAVFTSATENVIHLHLSNSGPKPSSVAGFSLKFQDLPIEDAKLRLVRADAGKGIVLADSTIDVGLTTLELLPRQKPVQPGEVEPRYYTSAEILPLLAERHEATLAVSVCESNDPPDRCQTRAVVIPARRLERFITKWMPDYVPSTADASALSR